MKYALVSYTGYPGTGTIIEKGELAEMQQAREWHSQITPKSLHVVLLSHAYLYNYNVGGECLYAWYGNPYKPYVADGVTVYVPKADFEASRRFRLG